jgi:hypothetical protein
MSRLTFIGLHDISQQTELLFKDKLKGKLNFPAYFTIQERYNVPALFVCFLRLSEQAAVISQNSFNRLVFIM